MDRHTKGSIYLELLLFLVIYGVIIPHAHTSITKIVKKRVLYRTSDSIENLSQGAYLASQLHGSIFSLFKDQNDNITVKSPNHSLYHLEINKKHITQISIHSSDSTRESIRFHPNGYTTPGRIEIQTIFHQCILNISLRGRVRRTCFRKN